MSVAIPAHDEEERLRDCLDGFTRQVDGHGRPLDPACFEVILLLNNCSDGSAIVAHRHAARHPRLGLHIVDLVLAPQHAHVGWARRLAMDEALNRFRLLGRAGGVIATTDADTIVAPDWVARTLAEIDAGADAVGGKLMLPPVNLLDGDPQLKRATLLHRRYERLTDRMASLLDPDPADPWPRHGDHGGASLAATARAYLRAGGLPPLPTGEDQAFHRALRRSGARFRHSPRVRVFTSDRQDGRAAGGMAATLAGWRTSLANGNDILVECPDAIARRIGGGGPLVGRGEAARVSLEDAVPAMARRVMELQAE
ncbi:glycosyl transferase family A [Skermanella stibiiresistens SB22]|uniref:Glycosyl transferase family A n=1 Tax=Skermanella stibiiresistens SB22 TaxID=1385369 RepID=W9H1C8_9PROT|nr:glycosyltransferase [Skermanella stibiiresistens]EWY37558.1 glycosyl transferase family A [Skermanella stibiiresistens SB22]